MENFTCSVEIYDLDGSTAYVIDDIEMKWTSHEGWNGGPRTLAITQNQVLRGLRYRFLHGTFTSPFDHQKTVHAGDTMTLTDLVLTIDGPAELLMGHLLAARPPERWEIEEAREGLQRLERELSG